MPNEQRNGCEYKFGLLGRRGPRYNKEKMDKDEVEVLLWQKMLEPFDKHGRMDVDACMESFCPYLEADRRTTNTVFHASLSPSPEDRLTDE